MARNGTGAGTEGTDGTGRNGTGRTAWDGDREKARCHEVFFDALEPFSMSGHAAPVGFISHQSVYITVSESYSSALREYILAKPKCRCCL